ncbi:hypothetical protein [Clostridium tyrobutyricum]|uniref:hypothetical protein n=1 Tax=Clostridium tyrobutyricum TaxID=1519 RepID=UPI001C3804CF|nr:hypothetical protein [Clostridium tyrobutyricum]MBV4417186.1 hypothetical protein [Clostridium tyrobutyricum]
MLRNEFNKILEAERWLYKYKSIKAGIKSLKEKYDSYIKSKIPDPIKITEIDKKIKDSQKRIEQIDRALSVLNKVEKEVIIYKCIDGMFYYEFTYKVYKSERQCKRIKKRALEKIAIALGL